MSVDSKSVKWPMNMQGHFLFRNTFLDPFVILFATNSAIIPEHGVAPLIQKSSWDDLIAFKAIKGWHAHRFEAREHVCVCVCVRTCACTRMAMKGNWGSRALSFDKATNGACGCRGNLCLNMAVQGSSFLHSDAHPSSWLAHCCQESALFFISNLKRGSRYIMKSPWMLQ